MALRMFWLLPLTVHGPSVNISDCALAPEKDQHRLSGCFKTIPQGGVFSDNHTIEPIPASPWTWCLRLGAWVILTWGGQAPLEPVLVGKLRVFSTTAHS